MDPLKPLTLMQEKYECLRYRPCMNRAIRLARWRPRGEWSSDSAESQEDENKESVRNGKSKAQTSGSHAKRFKPEDAEEDEPLKKVSAWLAMQNTVHALQPVAVDTQDLSQPEKQAKLTELDKQARELDKLQSLSAYADDSSKLIQEAFASINDRILFHVVPDLLKDEFSLAQLRQRCVEQLDKWPVERIQHILNGMTLTDVCRLEDVESRKVVPDEARALFAAKQAAAGGEPQVNTSSLINDQDEKRSLINGVPRFPADLFNDTEQILFELLQLAEDSERNRCRTPPPTCKPTKDNKRTSNPVNDLFDDADDVANELSMVDRTARADVFSPVSSDSVDQEIQVLQLKQEILRGILSAQKSPARMERAPPGLAHTSSSAGLSDNSKEKLIPESQPTSFGADATNLIITAKSSIAALGSKSYAKISKKTSRLQPDAEIVPTEPATSPISADDDLFKFFQQSSMAPSSSKPDSKRRKTIKDAADAETDGPGRNATKPHAAREPGKASPLSPLSSASSFDFEEVYGRRISREERASPSLFYENPTKTLKRSSPDTALACKGTQNDSVDFLDYFSEERYRADVAVLLSRRRVQTLLHGSDDHVSEGEISDD